ncbi:hypothetical protein [Acinetobacter sp. TUM15071]|uniref:hypothetical protein n=1 Tax=Acinetobacter sp. TUM15071 TaxID=2609135 RepID=UPI001D17EFC8|nr:hypothetical protein [Acinetobacter sp. TUM15071]
MEQNKEELLKHLAASLQDAKDEGGAILLVGAGISVSAGIPPAQKLMKIAIENFPNYFTSEEQKLAQQDLSQLQYNDIMTKLSNVKRKELFKWFIEGNTAKGIEKAKLNFAHIAIAELLKQGYFSRILTVNFDPLLIHACYMVGMYPFPAIYDLGAMGKVNAELLHDPSIVYLNGQHVGFVQRNTTDQLEAHKETLTQIVRSTGCNKTWIVAGYSGENDPLMEALNELRPYNNWLYWLEYSEQIIQKESHHFLENDEECKVIYQCDADEIFMQIAEHLKCSLDFIEKHENELAQYLEEINFITSSKGYIYENKIKSLIKILSTDENRDALKNINDEKVLSEIAWEEYGKAFKTPDKTEAIEHAKKGLKLFEELYSNYPKDNYKVYQCVILIRLFHYTNNESYLAQAHTLINQISPNDQYIHYIKARIHASEKDWESAINELDKITWNNLLESVNKDPDFSFLKENDDYKEKFSNLMKGIQ